jgi:hypothetical protein
MELGWIKIHRKLIDWEWYKDVNTFKLFLHLLLKANVETKKWQGLTINRGQLITSLKNLSHETGLTEKEVRTALSKLEKTKEVGKQSSSANTTLTMLNYDLYQSMGKPTDKQEANKGQGKGKPRATTKELEEDKELKVDKIEQRKLKFADTLKPYLPKYGKEFLNEFYKYWTEPNKSNSKFKMELETTWSLERRLETWAKNDKQFNKTTQSPITNNYKPL